MNRTIKVLTLLASTSLLFLGGCSAPPKPKVFYPPKPSPPRIQYLASFNSEYDIKKGGFSRLLSEQVGDKGLALSRARAAVFYKDSYYIADIGYGGLVRFDLQKQKATLLNDANPGIGKPMGLAIDSQGVKYVADIAKHQILAVGPDDKPLRTYTDPKGMEPVGIAADDNNIYVTEVTESRLHIIDKQSGKVVRTLDSNTGMAWPTAVDLMPDGNLAVLNMGSYKLTIISPSGETVKEFGKIGDAHGSFSRPKGLAIDRNGRIYALDAAFENLQLFNAEGQLYLSFAHGGVEPQDLLMPATVNISYDAAPLMQRFAAPGFKLEYVIAVSSQYGPSKINLYGFGRMEGADYSGYPE